MKKFILGIVLFVCGFLGTAGLMIATVMCPIIPWSYNNIEGWFAVILGMRLQIPLFLFIILALIGLFISVKEGYRAK